MGRRELQRARAIERLAAHLLDTGLAQTSLQQLADAAGVSDRMLLYYFADKADVMEAAMQRLADIAADRLAEALPAGKTFTPADMLQHASAIAAQPQMRRFMRFWLEVVSAASRQEAPCVTIAARLMVGWQAWVESRLAVAPGVDRQAVALAIIATIDGLVFIDICKDEATAIRTREALVHLTGIPGTAYLTEVR